jgi:hypothetical protein
MDLLHDIAREANQVLAPDSEQWARYLSHAFSSGSRDHTLVGIYGLGRMVAELDDLFGERIGGLSRTLQDRELTDELASLVGWWTLEDMSRVGYLEAWSVRGENPWKKRLAVIATIRFNKEGHDLPADTFRVVRHQMETEDPMLQEAVAKAVRHIQDGDQVERFLAWWAPRISKTLLDEASRSLTEDQRQRLLKLG